MMEGEECDIDMKYLWVDFVLAGVLFVANGYLGKLQYDMKWNLFPYGKFTFMSAEENDFTGNFFLKIVNPSIFLSIVAVVIQKLGYEEVVASLWLLLPCYWLWRLLFVIIRNLCVFLNLKYEGIACAVSLVLGESVFFVIIKPLLAANESLWISSTELRDALWFAIIAYIASTVWGIMKKSFSGDALYPRGRIEALIWKRYNCFEKRYGEFIRNELSRKNIVDRSNENLTKIATVVYAIMIYEDYNRPVLVRAIEYLVKLLRPKKTMTLGIMQVSTSKIISSKKSIQIALDRILLVFSRGHENPVREAILQHNSGEEYYEEVNSIYEELSDRFLNGEREAFYDEEEE